MNKKARYIIVDVAKTSIFPVYITLASKFVEIRIFLNGFQHLQTDFIRRIFLYFVPLGRCMFPGIIFQNSSASESLIAVMAPMIFSFTVVILNLLINLSTAINTLHI